MNNTQACVEAYRRHKNLKLVGAELGMPWQTVYVRLKDAGEPVTGDKLRYGSEGDRLSALAESEFKKLVPQAEDQNDKRYQAKVDFIVHGATADVKAARLHGGRYAFSVKKQEFCADFFICFAFSDGAYRVLMIPGEISRLYQTISLPGHGVGKWWQYEVAASQLASFFAEIKKVS